MKEMVLLERFSLKRGEKSDFQRKSDFAVPVVVSGEGVVCSKIDWKPEDVDFEELMSALDAQNGKKIGCDCCAISGQDAPRLSYLDGDNFSLVALGDREDFVVVVLHFALTRKSEE